MNVLLCSLFISLSLSVTHWRLILKVNSVHIAVRMNSENVAGENYQICWLEYLPQVNHRGALERFTQVIVTVLMERDKEKANRNSKSQIQTYEFILLRL